MKVVQLFCAECLGGLTMCPAPNEKVSENFWFIYLGCWICSDLIHPPFSFNFCVIKCQVRYNDILKHLHFLIVIAALHVDVTLSETGDYCNCDMTRQW